MLVRTLDREVPTSRGWIASNWKADLPPAEAHDLASRGLVQIDEAEPAAKPKPVRTGRPMTNQRTGGAFTR